MNFNLLAFYGESGYMSVRAELQELLRRLGDSKAVIELILPKIVGVNTSLDARKVVEGARDLHLKDPDSFRFFQLLVPVDDWCQSSMELILRVVNIDIKHMITSDDRFRVDVSVNRSELSVDLIEKQICSLLQGSVELDHPEKIVRVDVLGQWCAISLLRPHNVLRIS